MQLFKDERKVLCSVIKSPLITKAPQIEIKFLHFKGFSRWYITLGIALFLDVAYRPIF
jgi:hypothetical protein